MKIHKIKKKILKDLVFGDNFYVVGALINRT